MAYEAKDNQISLFPNKYKDSEKKPDLKGKGTVNGKAVEVAGWRRTGKDGAEFISLKFQEPYVKEEKPVAHNPELDQALPF